jgi:hypothetical protein
MQHHPEVIAASGLVWNFANQLMTDIQTANINVEKTTHFKNRCYGQSLLENSKNLGFYLSFNMPTRVTRWHEHTACYIP